MSGWRLGVDSGGTFTDVGLVCKESGEQLADRQVGRVLVEPYLERKSG